MAASTATTSRDLPRIPSVYSKKQGAFGFTFWFFVHRAQNYTLNLLTDLVAKVAAKPNEGTVRHLLEAYELVWETVVTEHAKEEDNFFFPWIREKTGAQGEEALARLEADHTDLSAHCARLFELRQSLQTWLATGQRDSPPTETLEQLATAAAEYAEANRTHINEEERVLVPIVIAGTKEADQLAMAGGMRDRGKALPKSSMVFPIFRDAACSNPEDTLVWEDTVPWFVRNVVLAGLSITSDYRRFNELLVNPAV